MQKSQGREIKRDEKTILEMRYTPSGWQARVSEISKKLKIAQKPKQTPLVNIYIL